MPMYKFIHHLLNVSVEIANKWDYKENRWMFSHLGDCYIEQCSVTRQYLHIMSILTQYNYNYFSLELFIRKMKNCSPYKL
jgi:hypothetical protein